MYEDAHIADIRIDILGYTSTYQCCEFTPRLLNVLPCVHRICSLYRRISPQQGAHGTASLFQSPWGLYWRRLVMAGLLWCAPASTATQINGPRMTKLDLG
jgi:hypothetical protein